MNPSQSDECPMLLTRAEWQAEVESLTEWLKRNRTANLERYSRSRVSSRVAHAKYLERLANDKHVTEMNALSFLTESDQAAWISESKDRVDTEFEEGMKRFGEGQERLHDNHKKWMAEADRLASIFPEKVKVLRGFVLKIDDTPKRLNAAAAWYKNESRLCDLLTSIREVFLSTINCDKQRIWPSRIEKYWILGQISSTLRYIASIVELLIADSEIRIPVDPQRFRDSAINIDGIVEAYQIDPNGIDNHTDLLEDNLLETDGFPFLTDVAQLEAFCLSRSEPPIIADHKAPEERTIDFFDGSVKCSESQRTIQRVGTKYLGIKAHFSPGFESNTWEFVRKLLAADGESVEFGQILKDQSTTNLRQIATTVRSKLKPLDISVSSVGKSTWKAVLKRREE